MYINIKIDNVPGPDSNKEIIVIHGAYIRSFPTLLYDLFQPII